MFKEPFKLSKKKPKPLWTLEDGITFSSLSAWEECREQFSLKWIDGVTPKKISIPLEYGSIIHHALENQFNAAPYDVIHTITEHYRKYRSNTLLHSGERNILNYILSLAEVIFPAYCEYWEQDDKAIEWVGREEKFKENFSLVDLDGQKRTIILRGMRDGLYRDKIFGKFGLFETKTRGKINEDEIQTALKYDMQTMLYCFCTYLATGEYPNQIIYNIIKRPDLYRRKNEDLSSYLSRLQDDIADRPEYYFKRYKAEVASSDIEMFRDKTLVPLLRLFIQWWDSVKKNPSERFLSPYHYLNSSALVGKYGKSEMWEWIFGDKSLYRIRTEVFPELEESFQVTWETLDKIKEIELCTS